MLCPVVTSDRRQHWNFSLFLLWTDCSYFRCKLDCVTSCTCSCMDRFLFFTFFLFPLNKNQLENEMLVFIWGACPCACERYPLDVGFSMAIASPAGWRISSNPLWSSQLKYPSFSFWIWWVFAGSLGTVDYSNGVFNILVSSLRWDLFSASFSWAGQGEIFAVQFISWNCSSVQYLWHKQRWLQIPFCVISILLPIPCLY